MRCLARRMLSVVLPELFRRIGEANRHPLIEIPISKILSEKNHGSEKPS